MKKKALIGGGISVVIVAVALLLIFVLTGKKPDSASTFSLEGIWLVASNVTDGTTSIPTSEYMVFENGRAEDFRDGNSEPYVSSSYEIKNDVLTLSEISRTYHIDVKTEEYVSLYSSENTFISLVKIDSIDSVAANIDTDKITGRWNIKYRNSSEPISDEYLIFEDGKLSNFRNGGETPAVEADYTWSENVITVPTLGMTMSGKMIDDKTLILIDINAGYVWILVEG